MEENTLPTTSESVIKYHVVEKEGYSLNRQTIYVVFIEESDSIRT